MPIFATPFGAVPLPEADKCNPELSALLRERAAADPRTGAPGSTPQCYLSADDWLDWSQSNPTASRVTAEMLRGVRLVMAAVNDFAPGQLESFAAQARGWFTVVRPEGHVSAANHPQSAWCAIYCVAAPPSVDERRDSGVLRLYETRLGTMFSDATNATMRGPYAAGHCTWRPIPGSVAVFPASLTHEIALLRAPGELILVTLRVRFVAPGQDGQSRW
jgi:Putative 2OG-Fe(II) oxygenase